MGVLLGVYPFYYSRKLSNYVLENLPDLEDKIVLRYEDLVELKKSNLEELKDLFGCDKEINDIKKRN